MRVWDGGMTAVEAATEASRVEDAVEAFLADNDPKVMDPVEFRGAVYDAGLAWIHFPEGWGGMGLPPTLQRIVEQKLRAAGAPFPEGRHFFGLALAGPTVVSHGSDDLKSRTLRRMYTGEDSWCQLFSEPGAGSDLAGLGTRAVRDGDEWS